MSTRSELFDQLAEKFNEIEIVNDRMTPNLNPMANEARPQWEYELQVKQLSRLGREVDALTSQIEAMPKENADEILKGNLIIKVKDYQERSSGIQEQISNSQAGWGRDTLINNKAAIDLRIGHLETLRDLL